MTGLQDESLFSLPELLPDTLNPTAGWPSVRGLCLDSRKVQAGDLFIALAGNQSHGMKYAEAAVNRGACAILYEPAGGGAELAAGIHGIPCIAVEGLGRQLGHIAARFFRHPSGQLGVVGITGTNGKTSCSHFLAASLARQGKAAVIGTLGWGVPGALRATEHTTPDAIEVHALLSQLAGQGYAQVAIEASSHGLEQGRLNGVRFEGGLFTNLSRDHLDYHRTMEAYLEAKLRLVTWPGLRYFVLNLDDDASAKAIIERAPPSLRLIGYRLTDRPATAGMEIVTASQIERGHGGLAFTLSHAGRKTRATAPLLGDFNVQNLLGVVGVLLAKGYALDELPPILAKLPAVPGRMERFQAASGPTAVVDYAHTPDALRQALVSLRPHCPGKLWVVFGCGGDRDKGKRPLMGEIAGQLADVAVVTDDNPRSEDGDAIIADILNGCRRRDMVVNRDRRVAISQAFHQLGPQDILLVAGKGHEETQEIAGIKYPFSDRELVGQLVHESDAGRRLCA